MSFIHPWYKLNLFIVFGHSTVLNLDYLVSALYQSSTSSLYNLRNFSYGLSITYRATCPFFMVPWKKSSVQGTLVQWCTLDKSLDGIRKSAIFNRSPCMYLQPFFYIFLIFRLNVVSFSWVWCHSAMFYCTLEIVTCAVYATVHVSLFFTRYLKDTAMFKWSHCMWLQSLFYIILVFHFHYLFVQGAGRRVLQGYPEGWGLPGLDHRDRREGQQNCQDYRQTKVMRC